VEVQLDEDLPGLFSFRAEKSFFTEKNSIYFTLTRHGNVSLRIFDLSGRMVSEILDGYLGPGKYRYEISTDVQTQGVYFVYILTDEGEKTLKIEKIQ
ncbi:T9SS type A sorting domain-containing protein, partial [candidate division WOR-3 bacterium]|nr:T9SS type A sorting domain-containing protein [candidate division WOR-3 bacterium]